MNAVNDSNWNDDPLRPIVRIRFIAMTKPSTIANEKIWSKIPWHPTIPIFHHIIPWGKNDKPLRGTSIFRSTSPWTSSERPEASWLVRSGRKKDLLHFSSSSFFSLPPSKPCSVRPSSRLIFVLASPLFVRSNFFFLLLNKRRNEMFWKRPKPLVCVSYSSFFFFPRGNTFAYFRVRSTSLRRQRIFCFGRAKTTQTIHLKMRTTNRGTWRSYLIHLKLRHEEFNPTWLVFCSSTFVIIFLIV